MPNPTVIKIKGKKYKGIELTEGEQLILIKENLRRLREWEKTNKKEKG